MSIWKHWAGACLIGGVLVVGCSAESDNGRGSGVTGGFGGAAGAGGDPFNPLPTGGAGGAGAGGTGGAGAGGTGGSGPLVPLDPVNIDECGAGNAAGLSDADVTALKAGGDPGAVRVLYPYDGTVMPRGLTAPLMMWDGDAATDAVYLHVKGATYELSGCYKPTAAGQLQYPQALWEMAELHTLGSGDPFTVELTLRDGGVVRGPIKLELIIAQADLKGSIYYNSYSSQVAAAAGGDGGAVLRITATGALEVFLGQSACTGCHSLSANGTRLITDTLDIAGTIGTFGGLFPGGGMMGDGRTYAIDANTPINPPSLRADAAGSNFAGVFPDGSMYVSNGAPGVGPRNTGVGTPSATLFEMDTATAIAGAAIPAGATMPTFSPDGKFLTFNDYAIQSGRGLAIMAFDPVARVASGYKVIHSDPAAYPGWPFFLPDNQGVVFAKGVETDFSGMGAGIEGKMDGPSSDLFVADVKGQTSVLLARAMGFSQVGDADSNTTYLPFGAEELHKHYYPTVSPVAAGGYFWVFFDSLRHYGNKGSARQLWGTAVKISPSGTYTSDPSHPAFYLPGQEWGTGNHRAFTALDPCRGDGESCTTGIDCCGGYCTDGVCAVPATPRCSKTDEACTSNADCCSQNDVCLAGYCGFIPVE